MLFPIICLLLPIAIVSGSHNVQKQTPLGSQIESESEFGVYHSQLSPQYSIRIKSQNATLCNTTVNQFTGWLDHGKKHLFFWYFDREVDAASNSIAEDELPLTLWLNGGPGASSLVGMLQELGPCWINSYGNGTVSNPYSWNKDTALLFVDQPVGTGFSYYDGDDSERPATSAASAEDMQYFLQVFMTQIFPAHTNGPLVLSGESYGGHYIPTLGAEIVKQNVLFPERPQLRLQSIAIGNPLVSSADRAFGYWETLCTTNPGIPEPIFNETRCDIMAENLPRCLAVMAACNDHPDPAICNAALDVCVEGVIKYYDSEANAGPGSRNRFDITTPCDESPYCYQASSFIEQYLNTNLTRQALSIPSKIKNWTLESDSVDQGFSKVADGAISTVPAVQYLLANEIDVLVYSGAVDLACNTASSKRWMNNMEWKGQAAFNSKDLQPWNSISSGVEKVAGLAKEVKIRMNADSRKKTRFALVTIYGAGHMVPLDQPEVALDVITRWLHNKEYI